MSCERQSTWRQFDIRGPAARPAPRCSRPAPAPARPGRSARWSTRYVAEGVATLEQMLVVTFGRAASQELRERVREQLVEAERALADPGRGRPRPTCSPCCSTRPPTSAAPRGTAARATRWRRSTPPPSPPPTSSASWCCASLGVAGDTDSGASAGREPRRPGGRGRRRPLPPPLRATSTDVPPFNRAEALPLARAAVGDPQARLEPARRRRRTTAGRPRVALRRRRPRRGRPPQAAARRPVATTTCSAGSPTPCRPTDAPAAAADAAAAGRSCWSTSSRTPTRCSGRSSTGPSPGTPRWC